MARLCRFHIANGLVSLAGNAALTYALVQVLKLPALPSAIVAVVVCWPANFLLADRWVYKPAGAP
jgi:putative flippase GtrA